MIRTRFAPSPTGFLHVGGVRTALFAWAFARSQGGECLLRIEDTDRERSHQAAIDAILEGLSWLGLDFDGEVYYQTQRLARYQEKAQQLLNSGHAYRCYMSATELDALREEQKQRGDKPRYDNRWRPENQARFHLTTPSENLPHVIRFRTPETGSTHFMDLIKGPIEVANQELDDFIIMRSDGTPTYNFCVVVDDADMQITHVIRGDDHINNTPRQRHVFEALGLTPPEYAHLPMIAGPDGQKLSKRHGAVSVLSYQEQGFLPEALLNYLARLGWSCGDQEFFDRQHFLSHFSLSKVHSATARFDYAKLTWLNQEHIKHLSLEKLDQLLSSFFATYADPEVYRCWSSADIAQRMAWGALYQTRSQTLLDFLTAAQAFFLAPEPQHLADIQGLLPALQDIITSLMQVTWSIDAIGAAIKNCAQAHGLALAPIGKSLRLLLLGQSNSPAFPNIIHIMGRETVLTRLKTHPALSTPPHS